MTRGTFADRSRFGPPVAASLVCLAWMSGAFAQGSALRPPAVAAKPHPAVVAMQLRLNALERVIQRLERRIESLEIAARRDPGRRVGALDRLDRRVQKLENRLPPSSVPSSSASSSSTYVGGTTVPDAPPRPLGTLTRPRSGGGAGALSEAISDGVSAAASADARARYDRALSLLRDEQDLQQAEAAFQGFIDTHPSHELAGNAYFWLGRTYFIGGKLQEALYAFSDGYSNHPDSQKAVETLYNLGLSLAALGKSKEACTAFRTWIEKFPDAETRLKDGVARQQTRNKCR